MTASSARLSRVWNVLNRLSKPREPLICGHAPVDISPGLLQWLRTNRRDILPPEHRVTPTTLTGAVLTRGPCLLLVVEESGEVSHSALG